MSVRDVVLVQDIKPRGFRKLARVSKLFTGQDGHVRGAELIVASPGKQAQTMCRPLQRLYPLELSSPSLSESVHPTNKQQREVETVETTGRPRRAAAERAQNGLKALNLYEDSNQD